MAHVGSILKLFVTFGKSECRYFIPPENTKPFLYRLKIPENQKFSGVFSGYKMGTLVTDGLKRKKKEKIRVC